MKPEEKLIQREMSEAIHREADFFGQPIITLTRVELNEKKDYAKMFIGVLPETRRKEVVDVLNRLSGRLAFKVRKRLRLRIIPRFYFVEETKTAEAAEIETLLDFKE
jgi:ribosome-binding factor A